MVEQDVVVEVVEEATSIQPVVETQENQEDSGSSENLPAPVRTPVGTLNETRDLQGMIKWANVVAKSRFFPGAFSAAQAIMLIEAGREKGFSPVESLTNLYIVNGRVSLSSHAISALLKRSLKYRFRVVKLTSTECEIEFKEKIDGEWEVAGVSTFTIKDAENAGLLGKDVWKKWPRNMLYARALSNGARWYCPDALTGLCYTHEELGVDASDFIEGEIIN